MTHEDRNEGDPLKRRRHSTLTLEFVSLLLIPSLDGIVLPASQIGYCHDSCLDALPLFYLSYPVYFQNIFSMLFSIANLLFCAVLYVRLQFAIGRRRMAEKDWARLEFLMGSRSTISYYTLSSKSGL